MQVLKLSDGSKVAIKLDCGLTADRVLAETGIDLLELDELSLIRLDDLDKSFRLVRDFLTAMLVDQSEADRAMALASPRDIRDAVMAELDFFFQCLNSEVPKTPTSLATLYAAESTLRESLVTDCGRKLTKLVRQNQRKKQRHQWKVTSPGDVTRSTLSQDT